MPEVQALVLTVSMLQAMIYPPHNSCAQIWSNLIGLRTFLIPLVQADASLVVMLQAITVSSHMRFGRSIARG